MPSTVSGLFFSAVISVLLPVLNMAFQMLLQC